MTGKRYSDDRKIAPRLPTPTMMPGIRDAATGSRSIVRPAYAPDGELIDLPSLQAADRTLRNKGSTDGF